jgi:hypothetical protein
VEGSVVTMQPQETDRSLPFYRDDNLIEHKPWAKDGYTVAPLFDPEAYTVLRNSMRDIIFEIARAGGSPIAPGTPLGQVHRFIGDDPFVRGCLLRQAQLYDDRFPIPLEQLVDRVSEIVGTPLMAKKLQRNASGPLFCLRVLPPDAKNRVSPFHRDVWLDCYLGTISFWVPLAGCNEQTSLRVVPGSHLWPDSEVTKGPVGHYAESWKRDTVPVRPNPQENEVLVFTSHLLHGSAPNDSGDVSRVSMEFRLCRK